MPSVLPNQLSPLGVATRRKAKGWTVTVDHTKVPADLTDFPLYVDLATMPAEFWAKVTSGGGDIRVSLPSGPTAREVVSCDPLTETGELHVLADLSSTVDTEVVIDADGASTEPAAASAFGSQAVWANSYLAVWHVGSNPTSLADSTANGYTATTGGAGALVNGKVGKAFNANGGFFRADVPDTPKVTVSMWAYLLGQRGWCTAIANEVWNNAMGRAMIVGWAGSGYVFAPGGQGNGAPTADVTIGAWQYLTGTDDDTSLQVSLDGAFTTPPQIATPGPSTAQYHLGARHGNDGYPGQGNDVFNGYLDEIRIASVARSQNWIAAEYANQSSPATFYAVG